MYKGVLTWSLQVTIPEEDDVENRKYSDDTEGEYVQQLRAVSVLSLRLNSIVSEAGGFGNAKSKIEIVQRINHQGEVNR